MNRCSHGREIIIKEWGDKIYSGCHDCEKEYENYRQLERLMDKYPNNYSICSNESCNHIFSKVHDNCHRCGSEPEQMSL